VDFVFGVLDVQLGVVLEPSDLDLLVGQILRLELVAVGGGCCPLLEQEVGRSCGETLKGGLGVDGDRLVLRAVDDDGRWPRLDRLHQQAGLGLDAAVLVAGLAQVGTLVLATEPLNEQIAVLQDDEVLLSGRGRLLAARLT